MGVYDPESDQIVQPSDIQPTGGNNPPAPGDKPPAQSVPDDQYMRQIDTTQPPAVDQPPPRDELTGIGYHPFAPGSERDIKYWNYRDQIGNGSPDSWYKGDTQAIRDARTKFFQDMAGSPDFQSPRPDQDYFLYERAGMTRGGTPDYYNPNPNANFPYYYNPYGDRISTSPYFAASQNPSGTGGVYEMAQGMPGMHSSPNNAWDAASAAMNPLSYERAFSPSMMDPRFEQLGLGMNAEGMVRDPYYNKSDYIPNWYWGYPASYPSGYPGYGQRPRPANAGVPLGWGRNTDEYPVYRV